MKLNNFISISECVCVCMVCVMGVSLLHTTCIQKV